MMHFRQLVWWRATQVACLVLLAISATAQQTPSAPASVDDLRRQFANPPDDSRIMMRWWWFGSAVTHDELERELRTMKQGGIGGVEVQPVYPLAMDDPAHGIVNLPYLSDGFLDALRFTSQKTHELGMRMDLTVGSGWPYGGPQVSISDAAPMLRVVRIKVDGTTKRVPLPNLAQGERLIATFAGGTPSGAATEQFFETRTTPEGTVDLPPVMAGEVIFFISSRTGQQVKRPAVNAEGFVVSHYDAAALDRYLRNVGDRLMQAFDAQRLYAVFCDSLEVYESNWADDFLQEFQKRRGYDLRPYLPALIVESAPKAADIRYDWARTLTELFNERFAAPLHSWAKQNRTLLRMQAYGIPPANLSSGSLVDLPEGEGAQWKALSATRWASSTSHIYGVPVTSSETWTWLHSPVFRASPLDMKAEADRHFLIGINQLIGHGWPYTPPGIDDPGWRFYAAAVFDEKNPWWTVMPDIARYLQRVSFLLRQGSPANDVAVYLPGADAMAKMRINRPNLFEALRDEIGPELVARIVESGYGLDFFDDDALRNAGKIGDKSLALGPNRYRIVILPGVERIPVETYRKLQEFVRAGGILIATKRLPQAAPGLKAADADSAEVGRISQQLFDGATAPAHFVKTEGPELAAQLTAAVVPDLALSPAATDVGFIHRHTDAAEIYFIANTGNQRVTTTAKGRAGGMRPRWWNPITGDSSDAEIKASDANSVSLELELAPYESRVLVFTRGAAVPSRKTPQPANGTTVDLSAGWHVTFGVKGPGEDLSQLHSWTDDDRTRYFSGTATYEKAVTVSSEMVGSAVSTVLSFGEGKPLEPAPLRSGMQAWLDAPVREAAVVYVNDQRAGSVWCPPYEVDITKFLHAGENRIRIEVSNLALNAMAGQKLPDYRLLNLRYGVRFEAQDMDKVQPVAAGLLGPITLVTSPSSSREARK